MDQKTEFALRAMNCPDFTALCREYGVSRKTGYKWQARFVERGLAGMAELSRRPHASPKGLPESVVCEIVRLKQAHPYGGLARFARCTGASMPGRFLRRAASSACWSGPG